MTSQLQAVNAVYEPLVRGKDTVLGYLPFSHMFGLALYVHQCLTVGVPLVILPRFEETAFFTAIEKYKITWMLIVPPILVVMRNSTQTDKYDLSSLRGACSAAAPLSEELCRAVEAKVKPLKVLQAYGMFLL
jgi:acyl-CoA synthetase (AMP-forming)/AMP-acid ligase II